MLCEELRNKHDPADLEQKPSSRLKASIQIKIQLSKNIQGSKSLHRSSQAKRKQLRREPRPKLKNRKWDSYIFLLKKN